MKLRRLKNPKNHVLICNLLHHDFVRELVVVTDVGSPRADAYEATGADISAVIEPVEGSLIDPQSSGFERLRQTTRR